MRIPSDLKNAGPGSTVAKWLSKDDRRAMYETMLGDVIKRMADPQYTFYLESSGQVTENGRAASVSFSVFNTPSKEITIYPPFYDLPLLGLGTSGQEGVIIHELGRLIHSMHIDGGPPGFGNDSKLNVNNWDSVISSIWSNFPRDVAYREIFDEAGNKKK